MEEAGPTGARPDIVRRVVEGALLVGSWIPNTKSLPMPISNVEHRMSNLEPPRAGGSGEQGGGELVRVEGLEIVGGFAQAHIAHGKLEVVGDGHHRPALGGPVQLGDDQARDAHGLMELLCLGDGVEAGGGVQD